MSDLIAFVFSLRGLVLALAVLAVWLRLRAPRGVGRAVAIALIAGYALASVDAVPYTVGRDA